MSLTLNGKRQGRAAQTDAREFRENLQIEADRERTRRANLCQEVCMDIRDMMTQEQYDAWWEGWTGSLEVAQVKLAELQTQHAVIDAQIPDPSAESREIQADIATFGGQELAVNLAEKTGATFFDEGPFSHAEFISERDIANEMRGGL